MNEIKMKIPEEKLKQTWDAVTCFGNREMTYERFKQAVEELNSESVVKMIKERIIEEHRKHPKLDWAAIAANKIYATLFK